MIYLITGSGGGKTTQALGLAVRALGHNKKVVIVQFMKKRKTGEYKFLKDKCDFKQFGREEFVNLNHPERVDKELANKGINYALKSLKNNPFLLVLDEINLACAIGLLKPEQVIGLLINRGTTHIVLTGRCAPLELINAADIVTEVNDITSSKKRLPPTKGLEY